MPEHSELIDGDPGLGVYWESKNSFIRNYARLYWRAGAVRVSCPVQLGGRASGMKPTSFKKSSKNGTGRSIRPGFEGGQMPLQRRIPKRGFNNIFAKAVAAVNLSTLNRKFEDGATVDIEALVNAGVVKNGFDAVKILGNGKLDKKLTVKVSAFSESAKAAIEAAGGKAEVI